MYAKTEQPAFQGGEADFCSTQPPVPRSWPTLRDWLWYACFLIPLVMGCPHTPTATRQWRAGLLYAPYKTFSRWLPVPPLTTRKKRLLGRCSASRVLQEMDAGVVSACYRATSHPKCRFVVIATAAALSSSDSAKYQSGMRGSSMALAPMIVSRSSIICSGVGVIINFPLRWLWLPLAPACAA